MPKETSHNGVMIGRPAPGNPFVFKQVYHCLTTGGLLQEPAVRDKIKTACRHARLPAEEYGEWKGIVKVRGYLGRQVGGLHRASEPRRRMFQVTTMSDIEEVLGDYLSERLEDCQDMPPASL